ncbi:D-glycerate dehydrogenase [candidate division WOR-3 bacterium]|nr:D-glycerate dehydrogenase [candidate division WOR-3 bacterium]MCK4527108.1 D-glycerate dehydrogenase [candidate division WOR-3 bacterium]
MDKIFVTYPFPEGWLSLLEGKVKIEIKSEDEFLSREELAEKLKDKDGAIVLLGDIIDKGVLEKARKLKVISNYAVGYDNIDIEEARKRGIIVTNTPDVLTNATAELTVSLIFAVIRRILESNEFLHQGNFTGWEPDLLLGYELKDSLVGILGAGRIGSVVAGKLYALGAKIVYYDASKNEDLEKETKAEKEGLKWILQNADIISIHLPLTQKTHHLIDEKELSMMKDNAFLINTGRGAIINEASLAETLRTGKLGGVALDVFENEPGINTHLLRMENVVLTPHIGSATYKARKAMAEIACRNLLAALKGEEPPNRVA